MVIDQNSTDNEIIDNTTNETVDSGSEDKEPDKKPYDSLIESYT